MYKHNVLNAYLIVDVIGFLQLCAVNLYEVIFPRFIYYIYLITTLEMALVNNLCVKLKN